MAVSGAFVLAHLSALALDAPEPVFGQQALGKRLGPGLRLYPELEVLGLYDTNFFFAEDGDDSVELDSFGVLVRPGLSLEREGNRAHVEGGARAEIGAFDVSDDDGYIDSDVFARANYILTRRNRVRVDVERNYGHDPFGLRRTELQGQNRNFRPDRIDRELDEFHLDARGAGYRFGAPGAYLNLDYQFRYVNKQYDNNRADGTRFLDFDQYRHRATLAHNYSPRTNLLLVFTHEDLTFDNTPFNQIPRGFEQNQYLAGASWLVTGKTSGRVLVGAVQHRPDDSRRNSFTEFDYELSLSWTPVAKTRLSIISARTTDESFLLQADFINTQEYTFAWDQRWSPRVASQFVFSEYDQNFEGFNRNDDFRRASLSASWLCTRAFALVGSVTYLDRDTNSTGRGFSKEVFSLGFKYSP